MQQDASCMLVTALVSKIDVIVAAMVKIDKRTTMKEHRDLLRHLDDAPGHPVVDDETIQIRT